MSQAFHINDFNNIEYLILAAVQISPMTVTYRWILLLKPSNEKAYKGYNFNGFRPSPSGIRVDEETPKDRGDLQLQYAKKTGF